MLTFSWQFQCLHITWNSVLCITTFVESITGVYVHNTVCNIDDTKTTCSYILVTGLNMLGWQQTIKMAHKNPRQKHCFAFFFLFWSNPSILFPPLFLKTWLTAARLTTNTVLVLMIINKEMSILSGYGLTLYDLRPVVWWHHSTL